MNHTPLSLTDVQHAAARIAGVAQHTPVFHSRMFDRLVGREVYFKGEHLQRTGSFKFRGAYNRLAQLSDAERARGVLAFSSGNHAQGVALAAALLHIPATIVMPQNAPPVKLEATRSYGAEIVLYDPAREQRETISQRLADERGLTLIPPFNDLQIIAGQGTAALELMQEIADLDTLVVPVGGGGLISGWALAARGLNPQIRIIGVEPEGADDVRRSLQRGAIVSIPVPTTIADGVRTTAPGPLTFALMRELVDDVVLVSDAEIMHAMRWVLLHMKQVVEPTGALTAAALIQRRIPNSARRVGTVFCGGNVAPEMIAQVLSFEAQENDSSTNKDKGYYGSLNGE